MRTNGGRPMVGRKTSDSGSNGHRTRVHAAEKNGRAVPAAVIDAPRPDVHELIRKTPDVREEKVRLIRTALQKGTYRIRPRRVAEKLLQEHLSDDSF